MMQSSPKEQWLVLVNPNAGTGKGKKDWNTISNLLDKYKVPFEVKFTTGKGDAIILAKESIEAGIRKIITVGGDGTLNEVVNGVFLNQGCLTTDVSLAMIPVGTGNDWGRMFGISHDYDTAIGIISDNKQMKHDVGLVSYYNGPEKKSRYFINIAGLGFESMVVRRTNIQKDKGRTGKAIYFLNLLASLLSYSNTRADVYIDGRKIETNVFSMNVGNGRYCGGGMRQTPDARPDDGIFDVTIINGIGKLEIIKNLKILYDGTILSHPKIEGYKCKNIMVTSDLTIYAECDGESLGHTPLEFTMIPSGINIVYGTRIIE
jgi:YegS/Rv2252/BmrU family lipid kinase